MFNNSLRAKFLPEETPGSGLQFTGWVKGTGGGSSPLTHDKGLTSHPQIAQISERTEDYSFSKRLEPKGLQARGEQKAGKVRGEYPLHSPTRSGATLQKALLLCSFPPSLPCRHNGKHRCVQVTLMLRAFDSSLNFRIKSKYFA